MGLGTVAGETALIILTKMEYGVVMAGLQE